MPSPSGETPLERRRPSSSRRASSYLQGSSSGGGDLPARDPQRRRSPSPSVAQALATRFEGFVFRVALGEALVYYEFRKACESEEKEWRKC